MSSGASFGHYPKTVTRVLAVEPEPRLRALPAAAARTAPVPVEVTSGSASMLPAADASHDAAVVSFVLCTVPDQDAALADIRRVLRPGGTLCFLEHVRAGSAGHVRAQRALEATVWPRPFGGCHLSRDTGAAIERAGFTITRLEEFLFPAACTPVSFHIAGHAAAPGHWPWQPGRQPRFRWPPGAVRAPPSGPPVVLDHRRLKLLAACCRPSRSSGSFTVEDSRCHSGGWSPWTWCC